MLCHSLFDINASIFCVGICIYSWCGCISYLLYHPNQISRTDWGGCFTHEPQTWELTLAINYCLSSVLNFTICCVWCNRFSTVSFCCHSRFDTNASIFCVGICIYSPFFANVSKCCHSLFDNASIFVFGICIYSWCSCIAYLLYHPNQISRTDWGGRFTHEPQTWELTLAINYFLFSVLNFSICSVWCNCFSTVSFFANISKCCVIHFLTPMLLSFVLEFAFFPEVVALHICCTIQIKFREQIEGDVLLMNPKHENWHLLLTIFFSQF